MIGGEIFVPKLKSYNIIQLCNIINPEAKIEITGIRPGEKIHECMINSIEISKCYECDNFFIVMSNTLLDFDVIYNKYLLNYKSSNIKKFESKEEYISGCDMLTNEELNILINS